MAITNYATKDGTGTAKNIAVSDLPGGGTLANAFQILNGTTEVGDTNPLPVRGLITNPSATLTLPNSTTTYAIGDLVANSATAGSVVPLTFDVARVAAGAFMITGLSVKSNRTAATSLGNFRLHLYDGTPTCDTVGDDGVFSAQVIMGSARYLGAIDFAFDRQHKDAYAGVGIPILRPSIPVKLASGTTIRGLVEARANYARSQVSGASETMNFNLDVFPC